MTRGTCPKSICTFRQGYIGVRSDLFIAGNVVLLYFYCCFGVISIISDNMRNNKIEASCYFVRLANTLLKDRESARDNHVLACNSAKYSLILIFFTRRLNNKPFLICLLITHHTLNNVATLPCNLSSMACFADISVSQGSVATYARYGGIFLHPFNCKFTKESSSDKFS